MVFTENVIIYVFFCSSTFKKVNLSIEIIFCWINHGFPWRNIVWYTLLVMFVVTFFDFLSGKAGNILFLIILLYSFLYSFF